MQDAQLIAPAHSVSPNVVVNLPQRTRRHPGDKRVGRNIAGYNRASRNNRVFADYSRADNCRIARDPSTFTNENIASLRWHSIQSRLTASLNGVRAGKQGNVVTEHNIALDDNTARHDIEQCIVDARVRRDHNTGLVAKHDVLVEERLPDSPSHPRPSHQSNRQTFAKALYELNAKRAHRIHCLLLFRKRLRNKRS
jgi:hypothetical protein